LQEEATTSSKKADIFYKHVGKCSKEQIPNIMDALEVGLNKRAMEIISESWNSRMQPKVDVVDNRPGNSVQKVKSFFFQSINMPCNILTR